MTEPASGPISFPLRWDRFLFILPGLGDSGIIRAHLSWKCAGEVTYLLALSPIHSSFRPKCCAGSFFAVTSGGLSSWSMTHPIVNCLFLALMAGRAESPRTEEGEAQFGELGALWENVTVPPRSPLCALNRGKRTVPAIIRQGLLQVTSTNCTSHSCNLSGQHLAQYEGRSRREHSEAPATSNTATLPPLRNEKRPCQRNKTEVRKAYK